jgi:hypothetical protein
MDAIQDPIAKGMLSRAPPLNIFEYTTTNTIRIGVKIIELCNKTLSLFSLISNRRAKKADDIDRIKSEKNRENSRPSVLFGNATVKADAKATSDKICTFSEFLMYNLIFLFFKIFTSL